VTSRFTQNASTRRLRRTIPLLIVFSTILLSPRPDAGGTIRFQILSGPHLSNVRAVRGSGGEGVYTVKDLSYRGTADPFITDIVISFDTPADKLLRDDMKHYRIAKASYGFLTGEGALGEGCARFFKKEDGVWIETTRGGWLGACGDLGSFTIEFRFCPYQIRDGDIMFSRIGYFSGAKRGIEIGLRNGRIAADLPGIFEVPNRSKRGALLGRGRILERNRWYHFALSYDRLSGKLSKYLDGEEEETIFMTASGEAFNGVYEPSFGDRTENGAFRCVETPHAVIGRGFAGLIDEFRISYRYFEHLEQAAAIAYRRYRQTGRIGRIPFNVEGVVTSPVYRFASTGTKVMEFRWMEDSPADTFIWMEFRISDDYFTDRDPAPRWYRVKTPQKNIYLLKINDGSYLRGKYYQWRAHLVPSPDGMRTPKLFGIELDYRLDLPPQPPRSVEALPLDRGVTLRWKKNTDHDILGYRIYYGTSPGTYDGILSQVKGKRITNEITAGGQIEVTITDDLIDENKALDTSGRLSYPFLKNTVLYYFAVTAYDSYKPDTPHNHESDLSRPVTARPYGGSEIRNIPHEKIH